jgi:solute carrier family 20 (sodium-dependent phosphate transporter)
VLIVWKGGASRIKLTDPQTVGVIIGVGASVALLVSVFFLPFLYCKVVKNDSTLKSYHILMGPFILRRSIPQGGEDVQVVQNYYRNHQTMEELLASRKTAAEPGEIVDPEKQAGLPPHHTSNGVDSTRNEEIGSPVQDGVLSPGTDGADSKAANGVDTPVTDVATKDNHHHELGEHVPIIGPRPAGKFFTPDVLFWHFKRFFFRGVDKDIVSLQGKRNILTGDLELMHAHAPHYNNKVEYMYSFLQVMTAATASFTHGANDVSK